MSPTIFVERLETERATFDDESHPLPKYQKDAFELCCKLLQEDEASLAQRSKQHRSSRLRARTLLIDVFEGLGAEVFLLCTLATTITKLSTITHSDLFPKLRAWWKTAEHPHGLTECANGLCDANSIGSLAALPKKRQSREEQIGRRVFSFMEVDAYLKRTRRPNNQAYQARVGPKSFAE